MQLQELRTATEVSLRRYQNTLEAQSLNLLAKLLKIDAKQVKHFSIGGLFIAHLVHPLLQDMQVFRLVQSQSVKELKSEIVFVSGS